MLICPAASAQQDAGFPVEAVEAVLLWQDPWLSARVFGAGLYALICWAQLAKGTRHGPLTCPAGRTVGGDGTYVANEVILPFFLLSTVTD